MNDTLRSTSLLAALLATLGLAACTSTAPPPKATASAKLEATKGNTANGTVRFDQYDGKVVVTGEVSGLKPGGEHGFHVHDKGDCSSGDGMSTGGHFNPTTKPHGAHGMSEHHTGDLPSLKADAYGVAKFSFESRSIAVGEGATNVVGRGLIVHRDPDDLKTQPTGNSGPRVACAVIR
jgi:superoxide dismutase, Cu-Zn family